MESAESEFVLLEKGEGLGGLRIIGSEVSGERLAHVRDVAKDSLLTEVRHCLFKLKADLLERLYNIVHY